MVRKNKTSVRTRVAPSPTGLLHVGTARAALFNELFARHHGGQFIVRIEDTDQQRSKKEYERDILAGLQWLGLGWDEGPDIGGGRLGPYRQSERGEFYQAAVKHLLASGRAYQVRGSEVIVFQVKEKEVELVDLIRGTVKIPTNSWGGDFIIARSIDDPLYHLAAVVDDEAMEISHVIRGEDHLTNTARHILLQRALGYTTPQYAHLPLLLDRSRRKLSKRAGDVSLMSYQAKGYRPEAMLNYLALLGWNPGSDQEIFSHEELVRVFSLPRVQKGGAIFNVTKLDSINKYYLQRLSEEELLRWGKEGLKQGPRARRELLTMGDERLTRALKTEQGRVSTNYELALLLDWARPSWRGDFRPSLLVWKESTDRATVKYLAALSQEVKKIKKRGWAEENLSARLLGWIKDNNWRNADVLWPMRVALTGCEHSPGPFEVAMVIGPQETISRLAQAEGRLRETISAR